MNKDPNKKSTDPKDDENVVRYGGYFARQQYEEASRRRPFPFFRIALAFLLVTLSVLGVIGLLSGRLFPTDSDPADGGSGTIKVPTQSQLQSVEKGTEEMIGELEMSLITVEVTRGDGSVRTGTGFFISEDGYAVCSSDLFDVAVKEVGIRAYTKGDGFCNATFVARDDSLGFALIKMEENFGFISVKVGNLSFAGRGEELFVVGSPFGKNFFGTALSGIVMSTGRQVKVDRPRSTLTVSVSFLDAVPNSTVYGAPVVDSTGNTVGICTSKVKSLYGDYCAVIPINVIYTIVNEMLS